MTDKERELTRDMLDLIDRIKNKTDYLNTDDRIPVLELEVILSKIEQLHQKAIGLKYLNQHADEIRLSLSARKAESIQEIIAKEATPEIVNETTTTPTETRTESRKIIEDKQIELEHIKADINKIGAESFNAGTGDIGEKLQQQPLSDIKSAIGINDKFLFINELFGGRSEEFEAMVGILNQFSSMEEAEQSLEKYNWKKDDETTQSFIKLVSRRYL